MSLSVPCSFRDLCTWVFVQGVSVQGFSVRGGLWPRGLCQGDPSPCGQTDAYGNITLPQTSFAGDNYINVVSATGQAPPYSPQKFKWPPSPHMVESGRYASYWNAFLCMMKLHCSWLTCDWYGIRASFIARISCIAFCGWTLSGKRTIVKIVFLGILFTLRNSSCSGYKQWQYNQWRIQNFLWGSRFWRIAPTNVVPFFPWNRMNLKHLVSGRREPGASCIHKSTLILILMLTIKCSVRQEKLLTNHIGHFSYDICSPATIGFSSTCTKFVMLAIKDYVGKRKISSTKNIEVPGSISTGGNFFAEFILLFAT